MKTVLIANKFAKVLLLISATPALLDRVFVSDNPWQSSIGLVSSFELTQLQQSQQGQQAVKSIMDLGGVGHKPEEHSLWSQQSDEAAVQQSQIIPSFSDKDSENLILNMMLSSKSGEGLNELVLQNQIEQEHLGQQQKCHAFVNQFVETLKSIEGVVPTTTSLLEQQSKQK